MERVAAVCLFQNRDETSLVHQIRTGSTINLVEFSCSTKFIESAAWRKAIGTWIADIEQTRKIDRLATEQFGIPVPVLMERAGRSVHDAVKELLPESGKIIYICGAGNNGGDGLVAARLAAEDGYSVCCLCACPESRLNEACEHQQHLLRSAGITPIFSDDARYERCLNHLGHYDLIVDAILGIGVRQTVRDEVSQAIKAINKSGVPVVSVDVPSGICPDTGMEMGESVWALRTVTFGLPKPFLFGGIGLEHAGYWTVNDIGIPHQLLSEPTSAKLVDESWVMDLIPERLRSAHKGESGHVMIVAGSSMMPGAAVLAARAALRAGAGLVGVASIPSVCQVVSHALPEALIIPLPEENGAIGRFAADYLRQLPRRADATVFGPGLGTSDGVVEFLREVWSGWDTPSVIDADALNAAAMGVPLPDCDCVLTPHPGEMARLLQESVAEVQADRFKSIRDAINTFHHCTLLKGPYTLVGAPDCPILVNQTGNPGMASGGMGDTLSGIIGTLLAQDLKPRVAGSVGAFWHGAAADYVAAQIGPVGYLASEVADALPTIRMILGQKCDCSCGG